jgi:hypothetical protein
MSPRLRPVRLYAKMSKSVRTWALKRPLSLLILLSGDSDALVRCGFAVGVTMSLRRLSTMLESVILLLLECWIVLMSHVSRLRLAPPSWCLTTPCPYRCAQADFAACCDQSSFDVSCFQAVPCPIKAPPDDHLPMLVLVLVHHNVSRL